MNQQQAMTTFNLLALSENGTARLSIMIGAKNFTYSEKDGYASFKFMKGASNKANYIKITLTPADVYDVEFGRIWGMDYKVISTHEGMYFDQLRELFETETGLYLSFK